VVNDNDEAVNVHPSFSCRPPALLMSENQDLENGGERDALNMDSESSDNANQQPM
jgi:hypothetical protein